MKRVIVFLSLLVAMTMSLLTPNAGYFKPAFGTDEEAITNPVIQRVNSNRDKLHVLFLEFGERDNQGLIIHETDESNLFKNNGDSYIIIYKNFELLVDCGLGLPKTYLAGGPKMVEAVTQLASIMKLLCDPGEDEKHWDACIFTHRDADHILGAGTLFEQVLNGQTGFELDNVYDFAIPTSEGTPLKQQYMNVTSGVGNLYMNNLELLLKKLNSSTKHYSVPSMFYNENDEELSTPQNNVFFTDKSNSVKYEFLNNPFYKSEEANCNSVCFLIEYKKQTLLFTGDLPGQYDNDDCESALIKKYGDRLDGITFYKLAHHGSNKHNENSQKLMDLLRPAYIYAPCVVGSLEYNPSDDADIFPSTNALNYAMKYTDYIYSSSCAIMENQNYTSLYGDVLFSFDGEEVEVSCTNNCDGQNHPNKMIYETEWISAYRNYPFSFYSFADDSPGADYFSCSLFKFGHIDILIDCGSRNSHNNYLAEKLKKYIVDGVIEYLIVSNGDLSCISALVGTRENGKFKNDGVLHQFKVEHIIDFGKRAKDDKQLVYYNEYQKLKGKDTETVSEGGDPLTKTVLSFNKYKYDKDYKPVSNGSETLKINVINPVVECDPKSDSDDCNSLVTVIEFFDKKFVYASDLPVYDDLIKNYKEYIQYPTVLRASQSTDGQANSMEFLQAVKPNRIFVGTFLNNENISPTFGNRDYELRLCSSPGFRTKNARVYVTGKMYGDNKQYIHGDLCYTYYNFIDKEPITSVHGAASSYVNNGVLVQYKPSKK